jgi:tetratricopeptide (TPR) repeat protein
MMRHAAFTADGRRVVTVSDGPTARVWDTPISDNRDADDLIRLAQMLSSTRIDRTGELVSITAAEFRESWRALRNEYPDDFVASPQQVLAWHSRQAYDCEAHGLWDLALSHLNHLDHLFTSKPSQGQLYARRARIHARMRRWEESVADFTKAIEHESRDPTMRIDRGDVYAELGRWDRAGADFEKAVTAGPSVRARTHLAMFRLAMGDRAAYRQPCADLLADLYTRHIYPSSLESGLWTLWTWVLTSDAVADREAVVNLAQDALNGAHDDSHRHLYGQTLAAATYRAGRFDEAVNHLAAGITAHGKGGDPRDWLLLALAHHRLGHADEARTWLDKAVRWLDASTKDKPADDSFGLHIDWQTWLALQVLRREAESTMQAGKAGP